MSTKLTQKKNIKEIIAKPKDTPSSLQRDRELFHTLLPKKRVYSNQMILIFHVNYQTESHAVYICTTFDSDQKFNLNIQGVGVT